MSKINFNLCCLIINSMIVKLFLGGSAAILRENGSAACLVMVLSAVIFALICVIARAVGKSVIKIIDGEKTQNIVSALLAAYFICASVYFVYTFSDALCGLPYIGISRFSVIALILISVFIIARGGKGPLFGLCGLCVPVTVAGLAAIILNASGRCDLLRAVPALGSGAGTIIISAFKNIFSFSEILLPLSYMFAFAEERGSKGIFPSILIALALYTAYFVVLMLSVPMIPVAATDGADLTRSIARFSGMNRLNMRPDAVYIIISAASAILYLSAAVIIIGKLLNNIGAPKKFASKKAAVLIAAVLSVFLLSGCGGKREVENTAYIIAVGIDASDEGGYDFTLQFSNPLKSGSDTDASAPEEDGNNEEKEEEKPTNNLSLRAPNIFEAVEDSKSYLGKSPTLSHLKLIVFSREVLKSGAAAEICGGFLGADEVRPETKLCAAESAKEYLTEAKPSLEESTARYYELLFSKRSATGGLETNLTDFFSRAADGGTGAVMPIVAKDGICGGMVFSGPYPAVSLSCDECRLVNLALGKTDEELFFTTEGGASYSAESKSRGFKTEASDHEIRGTAELSFSVSAKGSNDDLAECENDLEQKLRAVFDKIYAGGADIFEFKKRSRLEFTTEKQYQEYQNSRPEIKLKKFFIKFIPKI